MSVSNNSNTRQICLNSYRPLAIHTTGWEISKNCAIPPFVDSSRRREPDLEAKYPSITALCRAGNFAPYLNEQDVIIYITKKGLYPNLKNSPGEKHWRVVAILEVIKHCSNHEKAKDWYKERGENPPSNCMVDGNDSHPLAETLPPRKFKDNLEKWNTFYQKRACKYPCFLICTTQWKELFNPPEMTEKIMCSIFGRLRSTQNPPGDITEQELVALKQLFCI